MAVMMDFIATFFHQETVEQFVDDVRACCNGSETSGLTQRFDQRLILMTRMYLTGFSIAGNQCAFCEIRGRFCFTFCDVQAA